MITDFALRRGLRAAVLAAVLTVALGVAGMAAPSASALPRDNGNQSGKGCWHLGRYYLHGSRLYIGGTVYECRDGQWAYVGVIAFTPATSASLLAPPVAPPVQ